MNPNKTSTANKILQSIRKVQFICQFMVISKFGEKSDLLAEFLTIVQAFKFYYKVTSFYQQSNNLYIDNSIQSFPASQETLTKLTPIQKTQLLLDQIKNKTYQSEVYQENMYEQLASGKKIQIVNCRPIPPLLAKNKLTFAQIVGEILMLLRPLISIIAIRILGQESYHAYLISLAIDLFLIFVIQRGMKLTSQTEINEIKNRRKEVVWRYLFRRPFYLNLKGKVIEPIMSLLIKKERMISKFILSLFDMQSSVTLTL